MTLYVRIGNVAASRKGSGRMKIRFRHLLVRVEHGFRLSRVHLTYLWRHNRIADLTAPKTLTEHIQRRKLTDRNPRFVRMADKVAVKDHVSRTLGSHWVTPTLWRGIRLPVEPVWPMPFVIKSRHGCSQVFVVRTLEDYTVGRRLARRWIGHTYGRWLDEWSYGQIPKGLLVEPFIGEGGALPIDYKFFVFAGKVAFIQVHLARSTAHRWIVFDLDWCRVSLSTRDSDPPPPTRLSELIEAAETLGAEFDFVRVDLYEVASKPVFGELTFYPGSGLEKVQPESLDLAMGSLWTAARQRSRLSQERHELDPPSDAQIDTRWARYSAS